MGDRLQTRQIDEKSRVKERMGIPKKYRGIINHIAGTLLRLKRNCSCQNAGSIEVKTISIRNLRVELETASQQ